MELSKKTTILFPPWLHEDLQRLAREQGSSLGALVREACQQQYGLASAAERLDAVVALEALELPVADPRRMARESVSAPEELQP